MKLAILSLALSALVNAAAVPAEQQQDIDIPGDVAPATWLVQAFKDGPELTLQGTVQEVHAQLKQINANYDHNFGIPAALEAEAEESQLHRRTDFRNTHTICGNFPHIGITHLAEGINYLRHVGGRPQLPPRGATSVCSRVSCSYSTAIWWCNDDANTKLLASFGSIADGAQHVWDVCAGRLDEGLDQGQVSGQAFHPTNWNVIVRKDKC